MRERERERERNVLFNDALNTFYLRLYGVRHMVKDHSDIEKGNPLPPHRLLLSINSKGLLYAPSQHRITHTTYHIPVLEPWLEREIAQWVHPMKDRSDDPSHHERTLYFLSYVPLSKMRETDTDIETRFKKRRRMLFNKIRQLKYKTFLIKLSFSSIGQDKSTETNKYVTYLYCNGSLAKQNSTTIGKIRERGTPIS